ncbi:type II secretion system F family protein, partial [Planctomycetota bacterium]|nr:type II secretion system F family protein [Planctomycetota bacterium]
MPVFEYKALDGKGKSVSNVVDADTPRDARAKLRQQKIYVTEITEVRGTQTKREVVQDELGQKKVVVSTEMPPIVKYTGGAAILSAIIMLFQLLLLWRGEQTVVVDGVEAESTFTATKVVVTLLSAVATAMFGYVIIKGRTWALFVVALFALLEFIGPFSAMVTENDFFAGVIALAYATVGIMCVLSFAKIKDLGADEGTDKIQNLREVSSFTRQLATLLHSGIPLAQALAACIEQADTPGLQKVLRHLREQVSQGTDFGNALETCPGYFNALYVNMVRAGQASGQLDDVLTRVADYLANQNRIRNK